MASPTPRGPGRPSRTDPHQNQVPDGPLTLDEARRVAQLHQRDLANQQAQEDQPEDFDSTDEYDEDGDAAEAPSDEDVQWASRAEPEDEQDGIQGDLDVDIHDEAVPGEYEYEEMEDAAPVFDPAALGLKEINNLAHFSVSSHKPGNGVVELLSEDLDKFWQSDGQQPHLLTIHFLRRVEIRAIRFYVDHLQDESYTPIAILWHAGTGHHDLMQFGYQQLSSPSGWQDIKIEGLGGGHDGNSLCCYIVQMQVKENHQNGKDTHIRGIKIYALDEKASRIGGGEEGADENGETPVTSTASRNPPQPDVFDELLGDIAIENGIPRRNGPLNPLPTLLVPAGMSIPDFMREPEIR